MPKPCRCLTDQAMPGMKAVIEDVIASLPPAQLADSPVYRARLDICLACPELADGTCRLCGCFVEVRAAQKKNQCPHVPGYWGPQKGDSTYVNTP